MTRQGELFLIRWGTCLAMVRARCLAEVERLMGDVVERLGVEPNPHTISRATEADAELWAATSAPRPLVLKTAG